LMLWHHYRPKAKPEPCAEVGIRPSPFLRQNFHYVVSSFSRSHENGHRGGSLPACKTKGLQCLAHGALQATLAYHYCLILEFRQ
jgi:hypothetical protein